MCSGDDPCNRCPTNCSCWRYLFFSRRRNYSQTVTSPIPHPARARYRASWPSWRTVFRQWLLANCVVDPQFVANNLFTDEMQLKRKGIVNFHNTRIWADKNSSYHRRWRYQHLFAINTCVVFFGDQLLKITCLTSRPTRAV